MPKARRPQQTSTGSPDQGDDFGIGEGFVPAAKKKTEESELTEKGLKRPLSEKTCKAEASQIDPDWVVRTPEMGEQIKYGAQIGQNQDHEGPE
jgi:hypothetical protein